MLIVHPLLSSLKPCRGWERRLFSCSIFSMLIAITVCALAPREAGSAEPEIVARVNGAPVTSVELQRMLADAVVQGNHQQKLVAPDPDGKELKRLAVRELIDRQLILQEADRRNFKVTQNELDQALSVLRRRFKDIESFGAWMLERGLDDTSLFDALRVGMLTNRVTSELVAGVRVTEEEVQEYYEAHQGNLPVSEEVRLRIIAVKSEEAAEEVLTALRKGESFGHLARQRSIGQLAAQGGDTGWVDARTLPPALQQTVGKLKTGDVGGPLQKSADEFLIVGLEGRRPLRAKSLAEARSGIEQRLLAPKQQETIQKWLKDQEKKSKIELFLEQP